MKVNILFLTLVLFACTSNENESKGHGNGKEVKMDTLSTNNKPSEIENISPREPLNKKVYANERFKEVTVEQIGAHQFRIKGKGQIFEAAFSWVIEDGHEELKKGFVMTDAGAPEWGNFNFVVDVEKKRPNSKLHLILFETSAKDGSRQYILPILLY
jgi:hypothetical protein